MVARRTGWDDPNWRTWKVESIRRSLTMLQTNQTAGLSRDEAMRLVVELQKVEHQLRTLREELRRLAGQPD